MALEKALIPGKVRIREDVASGTVVEKANTDWQWVGLPNDSKAAMIARAAYSGAQAELSKLPPLNYFRHSTVLDWAVNFAVKFGAGDEPAEDAINYGIKSALACVAMNPEKAFRALSDYGIESSYEHTPKVEYMLTNAERFDASPELIERLLVLRNQYGSPSGVGKASHDAAIIASNHPSLLGVNPASNIWLARELINAGRALVADVALDAYNFGMELVSSEDWDAEALEDTLTKMINLQDGVDGEQIRAKFHAYFSPGSANLVNAAAFDQVSDKMIGSMPPLDWGTIAKANPSAAVHVVPSEEEVNSLIVSTYGADRSRTDLALSAMASSVRLRHEVATGKASWTKVTGPKSSKQTALEFMGGDIQRRTKSLETAIMAEASAQLATLRSEAANSAYQAYEFDCAISESANWADTDSDSWSMIVSADISGSENNDRLSFRVNFAANSAEIVDVRALDMETGNEIGYMPEPEPVYNVTVTARKYSQMQEGDADRDVEYEQRAENEDMSPDEIKALIRDLNIYQATVMISDAGTQAKFESVTPDENREYFEQGIETYYDMHLHSVNGEPVTLDLAKAFGREFSLRADQNYEQRPSTMRMG